jgi:hypothetical protein
MDEHEKFYQNNKNKEYIFQIGFNKCGTRSIHAFFCANNIKSKHYDDGNIAQTMFRHHHNNKPLIDIRYKDVVFFNDMESIYHDGKPLYVAQELFKKLYYMYPNSLFILNTRNKQKWIKSRILHCNYLEEISKKINLPEEEVIKSWSKEWDDHHNNVINFFKDKKDKLLVFNIENDDISKLLKFFSPHYNLNKDFYIHYGKTKLNNA